MIHPNPITTLCAINFQSGNIFLAHQAGWTTFTKDSKDATTMRLKAEERQIEKMRASSVLALVARQQNPALHILLNTKVIRLVYFHW